MSIRPLAHIQVDRRLIGNPLLALTASPPIPEAKAWVARYDGSAGPLIDLSQAVPGYPPHPGAARPAWAGRSVARGRRLRRHHRRCDAACATPSMFRRSMARRIDAGERRDHRRLQPGLLRRRAGARQGRRCGDPADALVFQSQDDARHAGDRRGAAALPGRDTASCPTSEDARRCSPTAYARHRAGHAQQSDRRRLSARDHRRLPRALRRDAASRSSSTRPIATSSPPMRRRTTSSRSRDGRTRSSSSTASRSPTAFPAIAPGRLSPDAGSSRRSPRSSTRCRSARRGSPQLVLPWAIPALADWRDDNRPRSARRAPAFRTAIAALDGWRSARSAPISPMCAHPFPGPPRCRRLRMARARNAACSAFPAPISARPGGVSARRLRQCGCRAIARIPAAPCRSNREASGRR